MVVPRLHVASLFDLPVPELASVWEFVARVREELTHRTGVTAFNIGLNDGRDAGQTRHIGGTTWSCASTREFDPIDDSFVHLLS